MPLNETGSIIAITKITGYLGAISLFEYLNIINTQVYILSILMIIDFISGISKQFAINPVEITSRKASIGAIKKILILMVFLSIALMFKGIGIDANQYLKGIISIFMMAETYSIIQNSYTVFSGKELPEFDVISLILKKMGDTIQKLLEDKIK